MLSPRMERMISLFRVIKSEETIFERNRIELYKDGTDGFVEEAEPQGVNHPDYVEAEVRQIYEEARQRANQSAARILEGAYAKRDKIVSTAEEDVKRVRQKAVREGYEAGLLEAAAKSGSLLKEMQGAVGEIRETEARNMELLSDEIIGLSLSMAEKILHKRLEENENELKELAHAVIQSEKDKKHIHLQVSNQMMRLVEQMDQELEQVRERYQSTIKVKAVPMPPGTCRVETEDGITDASVYVQLENLREQLELLMEEG